jgi:hypothetical protein
MRGEKGPSIKIGRGTTGEYLKASLGKPVQEVNRIIAGAEMENAVVYNEGKQVLLRNGKVDEVRFTDAELKMLKGAVVTHNHPYGTSFSRADVSLFKRTKMAELHATAQYDGVVYSISPPKDSLFWKTSARQIAKDHDTIRDAIFLEHGYDKKSQNNAPQEVLRTVINDSIKALDLKYNLNYKITQL